MKRVLTFVLNYFPGYMSGGVARTILNTTDWLGAEFQFLIVTRDRDLGSTTAYSDVAMGAWNPMGNALVRYLAPHELSMASLERFINATDYDILHLNSFFDPVFTIRVMMNSTRPISTRAARYSASAASVNSLAMTADIVYCGANSDAAICGLFPITIVTAIVSPSARPNPSMTAPMMPVRAK